MSTVDPVSSLGASVAEACRQAGGEPSPALRLERPPKPEMGDYSSNAAMVLAGSLGRPPREVAEELAAAILGDLGEDLAGIEVAGPGFLNLFLSDSWYRRAVDSLSGIGAPPVPPDPDPRKVMVEFVSANPTGPLTAASGRHAAYGDAVARLLDATGHQVMTEYYVNDGGSQVEKFGESIEASFEGREPPEGGYRGDYIAELAERARAEAVPTDELGAEAVGWMLERIASSLEAFGVGMDGFFSERSLYRSGRVEAGLERLRESGHTYESDGALWLRTTEFGDDKDRVLVRSGGEPTYFGADVAYHADKLERGHALLIDVLGADHHGYVARMSAAVQALGNPPEAFEAQILQLIHLVEEGEKTKMSKRAGDIVTLDELIADVGVDAARFFLLQRSQDHTIDLDLELARRRSSDNPVYYVQYAHARIQSILRKAAAEGSPPARSVETVPVDPSEKALIATVLSYPAEVAEAAERRAPHRICAYSMELAAAFHAFYRDCKVVGAADPETESSRLALCELTAATISSSLALLGISAPDEM